MCVRERCPYAVVGVATEARDLSSVRSIRRRRAALTKPRAEVIDMPLDVLLGKPPKMQRDVRRRARRIARARSHRRRSGARRVRRAAPSDRRQQALPDHDRRPHRRRPVEPRPDGRAVAGAGRRLRGHARRLLRLRRRGDGDRRAHAARRARRAGVGPDGGRRGDHQPARRADRARARQAQLQLDGGVQRRPGGARRRRGALRHRARGRHGAVPGARHQRSGRQGLACRCARAGAMPTTARRSR